MEQESRIGPGTTATLAQVGPDAPEPEWSIVVAHHPQARWVGSRYRIRRSFVAGRGSVELGPSVFDDEHVSRRHANFELENDQLFVVDQDSHNGTFVNANRIERQLLKAGDVVTIGRLLLLVERAPRPPETDAPPHLPGISEPYLQIVATLRRAADRRAPMLLWGETGTGKTALAEALQAIETPDALPPAVIVGATLPVQYEALAAVLEAHPTGTIALDRLDEAPPAAQQHLVTFLDGAAGSDPPLRHIVATSSTDPDVLVGRGALRADLLHRFRGWRVRVPPLRERLSDVVLLATMFAQRYAGSGARVRADLMMQLLRHGWPGNVRELESIIERAAVQGTDTSGDVLGTFPGLDGLLRPSPQGPTTSPTPTSSQPHVLHRRGHWHRSPDGVVQDLRRRRTLARVLAVLIEHRDNGHQDALPMADLLAQAWPNEHVDPRTGANRVYVALTALRKLGLRDLLVRTEAGYLLDPDASVTIVDHEL